MKKSVLQKAACTENGGWAWLNGWSEGQAGGVEKCVCIAPCMASIMRFLPAFEKVPDLSYGLGQMDNQVSYCTVCPES